MARRLKQPAVRALVHATIISLGEETIPLTDLARDRSLRGVDFGRIMSACNWLAKQGKVMFAVHDFHGDVIIPLAA